MPTTPHRKTGGGARPAAPPPVRRRSVRAEDVHDEYQRVGALDAALRVAGLSVAVRRGNHQQDPAADLLADEGLVPAGDDAAGADREAGRGALREGRVEDLPCAPHHTLVVD